MVSSLRESSYVVSFAVTAALSYLVPRFSPVGAFFGVPVEPGFEKSEQGRAVVRLYQRVIAGYVALGALGLGLDAYGFSAGIGVLGLLAPAVGMVHGYLLARARALPFEVAPTGLRSATIVPRSSFAMFALWQLPAWFALGGAAWYLLRIRDALPASVAIHFDANGAPDRFVPRDSNELFAPFVVAAVVMALDLGLGATLWQNARKGSQANWSATRVGLILSAYAVSLVTSMTALVPVLGVGVVGIAAAVVPVVLVAATITIALQRRGTNASTPARAARVVWGIFYVNPDDPALWVPKTMGIGYTLNYGHNSAWLVSAALSGFVVLASFATNRDGYQWVFGALLGVSLTAIPYLATRSARRTTTA